MKNLIKTTAIFFLLFNFLSCQKDKLSYTEKRLIGEWEFDKNVYKENFSLQKEDLTKNYENSSFEFFENGVANFNHQNDFYSGTWELIINNLQGAISENIIINLTHSQTSESISFIFNNVSINRNTMWADKQNYNGWYRYKLKRI